MSDKVDYYLGTLARLEPDIAAIDASAFYASAAISLKRIADALQPDRPKAIAYYDPNGGTHILRQVNENDSRNVYRGGGGRELLFVEVDG